MSSKKFNKNQCELCACAATKTNRLAFTIVYGLPTQVGYQMANICKNCRTNSPKQNNGIVGDIDIIKINRDAKYSEPVKTSVSQLP